MTDLGRIPDKRHTDNEKRDSTRQDHKENCAALSNGPHTSLNRITAILDRQCVSHAFQQDRGAKNLEVKINFFEKRTSFSLISQKSDVY